MECELYSRGPFSPSIRTDAKDVVVPPKLQPMFSLRCARSFGWFANERKRERDNDFPLF
jgi:hypothetical protein